MRRLKIDISRFRRLRSQRVAGTVLFFLHVSSSDFFHVTRNLWSTVALLPNENI